MTLKTIRRFLSLPLKEKRLAIEALMITAVVRAGLLLFPFSRTEIWLDYLMAPFFLERPGKVEPGMISRAVQEAGRLVPHSTCLVQALAAQVLLAAHGYTSSLCIGVMKGEKSPLAAHAWVEVDGSAVIGEPLPGQYTRLMARERRAG